MENEVLDWMIRRFENMEKESHDQYLAACKGGEDDCKQAYHLGAIHALQDVNEFIARFKN